MRLRADGCIDDTGAGIPMIVAPWARRFKKLLPNERKSGAGLTLRPAPQVLLG